MKNSPGCISVKIRPMMTLLSTRADTDTSFGVSAPDIGACDNSDVFLSPQDPWDFFIFTQHWSHNNQVFIVGKYTRSMDRVCLERPTKLPKVLDLSLHSSWGHCWAMLGKLCTSQAMKVCHGNSTLKHHTTRLCWGPVRLDLWWWRWRLKNSKNRRRWKL